MTDTPQFRPVRDGDRWRVYNSKTCEFAEPYSCRSVKREAQVRADIRNRPMPLIKVTKLGIGCRVTMMSPVPIEVQAIDCVLFSVGVGIMLDRMVEAGFDPDQPITLDLRDIQT